MVRGGLMESDRLLLNAKDVHDDEDVGEWAVCAASDPDMSPAEIAKGAEFGHRQMMVSRVEILRSRGFDVVPDPEEGPVHALIMLPVEFRRRGRCLHRHCRGRRRYACVSAIGFEFP